MEMTPRQLLDNLEDNPCQIRKIFAFCKLLQQSKQEMKMTT